VQATREGRDAAARAQTRLRTAEREQAAELAHGFRAERRAVDAVPGPPAGGAAATASARPGGARPSGGEMGLTLVSSALLAAHGGSLEITLAPKELTVAGLRRKLAAIGLAVDPQTQARPRLMLDNYDGVELREAEADDGHTGHLAQAALIEAMAADGAVSAAGRAHMLAALARDGPTLTQVSLEKFSAVYNGLEQLSPGLEQLSPGLNCSKRSHSSAFAPATASSWSRARPASRRSVLGSVALALCATAHLLYTRLTKRIGTSTSEATMRPNPRLVAPRATVRRSTRRRRAWPSGMATPRTSSRSRRVRGPGGSATIMVRNSHRGCSYLLACQPAPPCWARCLADPQGAWAR
jgi:hypothetical protein